MGVYRLLFKSGLHLPDFDFLETILDYYALHITQITPNGFHKVLCFTLLCVALDVLPSINLFHYFYLHMSNGEWVSFSLRHGLVELCEGLSTSIKYWKEHFFYVHSSTFSSPMAYGATADRVADPDPEFSLDEMLITEMLASNIVRWVDHDEVLLGMAGYESPLGSFGQKTYGNF